MNKEMYMAMEVSYWIAIVMLASVFWKAVLVSSVVIGMYLFFGYILSTLLEEHCPNDGEVMQYNSYGGYECPKCGRYEKNGSVLENGVWGKRFFAKSFRDPWNGKEVDVVGRCQDSTEESMSLCKLKNGAEYYRYFKDNQIVEK